MKRRATHVIALAALISCPILAAGRPAPAQAPTADQPIGLPRVSDYEPIRELRDIHFDFGEATIRRQDPRRERGLAARPSAAAAPHRGALRQSGDYEPEE
jgi:hypothetical protein